MTWYGFFKALGWAVTRSVARVSVEGRQNLPETGGLFLIPNHASALDALFVQSSIPRNDVHTMTKSTQFNRPLSGWALRRVRAFPVRRFDIDAQAVRTSLRLVRNGHAVCIFIEGERSWDGTLQPLQRGTARMLLKAGVPVVPVGIRGSWDVRPRWGRRFLRRDVRVRFGEPLTWPAMESKDQRERALPGTLEELSRALLHLSSNEQGPT